MIREQRSRITVLFLILLVTTLIAGYTPVQAKPLNYVTTSYSASSNLDSDIQILDLSWGLGQNQTEYVSNDKPYDWYIAQGNTGEYSNNNCGPSSVTMALKWIDGSFNKTAEDARNTYLRDGGWWTTNDITNYLTLNSAKYSIQSISESFLKNILKQGNIGILCIDTSFIPYNGNAEQRVGRFYSYSSGHFIIVKGYRVVDEKTYFEVYDPNSWNEKYRNGQVKGKDRYFLSDDLINAASNWWNNSIIIEP